MDLWSSLHCSLVVGDCANFVAVCCVQETIVAAWYEQVGYTASLAVRDPNTGIGIRSICERKVWALNSRQSNLLP